MKNTVSKIKNSLDVLKNEDDREKTVHFKTDK